MLKVEHLTKVYEGGTLALEDVSFEVKDGEFMAVIGLSGSGKSTLLRCINRLIEPTEGSITWDGVDITAASQEDLRRIRRRIGMVFQDGALFPHLTVRDNVTVMARYLRRDADWIEHRLVDLAQLVRVVGDVHHQLRLPLRGRQLVVPRHHLRLRELLESHHLGQRHRGTGGSVRVHAMDERTWLHHRRPHHHADR